VTSPELDWGESNNMEPDGQDSSGTKGYGVKFKAAVFYNLATVKGRYAGMKSE
jgi:hypothetical protein